MVKLPWVLFGLRNEIQSLVSETHNWWRQKVHQVEEADFETALMIFEESKDSQQKKIMTSHMITAALSTLFWGVLEKTARPFAATDEIMKVSSLSVGSRRAKCWTRCDKWQTVRWLMKSVLIGSVTWGQIQVSCLVQVGGLTTDHLARP